MDLVDRSPGPMLIGTYVGNAGRTPRTRMGRRPSDSGHVAASARSPGGGPPPSFIRPPSNTAQPSLYRSKSDCVDPDPARAKLSGPSLRQGYQGGLGGSVGHRVGQAKSAGHTADVDDAALAPGRHPWGEGGDEVERCADIVSKHAVEAGDVEVRG